MRIGFDGMPFTHDWTEGMLVYNWQLLSAMTSQQPSNEYWYFFRSLRQDFKNISLPGDSFSFRKFVLRLPILPSSSIIPSSSINLKMYFDIFLPYYLRKNKIDIFHGLCYYVPRRTKVGIVTTIHDIFACSIPWALSPYVIRIRKEWYAKALKRSNMIIAISEATKNEILKHYDVSQEDIVVIPLASSSLFKPVMDYEVRHAVRKQYGLPERFILGLGATHKRKTPESLLRAYARSMEMCNHGCHLVFFGGGPDLPATWAILMRELKIEGRVKFIHSIPSEDLAVLYSLAELFVLPSKYEGFGIPILEAMSCGTPVITSNLSSMPEVAGKAAVLIDPYNIEEIASAISDVICDDSLMNEMSKKGLVQASQFSWDRTARETVKVYEKVYWSMRSASS